MSPYLDFVVGNRDNLRGRALCYIRTGERHHSKTLQRRIDIDGAGIKEAIYQELLEGRLLVTDVFEPFFVSTIPLDRPLSHEELLELAKRESRDLIPVSLEQEEARQDIMIDQTIARYATLYREDIYIRLTHQLANEIFRKKRCSQVHSTYVAIFKIAGVICLMIRAMRDGNKAELFYHGDSIRELQKEIPFIDTRKIAQTLEDGDNTQWQEITDCVDALFLTLKKHWPFPLEMDVHLKVKEDCLAWLKEELPALYEEYFLALFHEEYERAGMLKQAIDSHYTSQSLEECH